MSLPDVEGHVLYALSNAQVKNWPFPHFFVENVFPEDFYRSMMRDLAAKSDYVAGEKHYNGRKFGDASCIPGLEFMQEGDFLRHVCKIFPAAMKARFSGGPANVYPDLRLVRDQQGYFIGPHTDAQWKVVSLLFYMPPDAWFHDCGTSIYLPKDRTFRCLGGPHHKFHDFDLIYTAPYLPNSCFGFFKTDNSFHGVEPITKAIRRDVLLYNLYVERAQLQPDNTAPEPSP